MKYVVKWQKVNGFPEKGSLSVNQLKKIEEQLREEEAKLLEKGKVRTVDLRRVSDEKECLKMWMREAERRENKAALKELPREVRGREADAESASAPLPPPYNTENKTSFPCSRTVCASPVQAVLQGLKADADLDSFPSPSRSAPHASPPEDATASPATEERQPRQDEAERMTLRSDTALSHTRSASRAENAPRAEATKTQQRRAMRGKNRSKDSRHGYYALPFATDQPEYSLTDDERDDTDDADGSEEVEKFQTGQRTRRQRQAKGESLQLPMVEVAGPEGPILVHRPWTQSDIADATSHLPDPLMLGVKFGEQLLIFCQEYRPTGQEIRRAVAGKLKPCDLRRISPHLPEPTLRIRHLTYEHGENLEYCTAVTHLMDKLKEVFPDKVDMSKIQACKQRKDESVDDFIHRMTTVFEVNGGIPKDDMTGTSASTYEHHLCGHIFRGLRPDVAAEVRRSYVGGEDEPRLTELRLHARHAQNHLDERKSKKEEKQSTDLDNAALTLYKAATNSQGDSHDRGSWHGRGQGTRRDRRDRQRQQWGGDPEACFFCGEHGHWKRNCPNRGYPRREHHQHQNNQAQGRRWVQAD